MWGTLSSLFGRGNPQLTEIYVHFEKKKLRVVFSSEDYNSQKQVPLRQLIDKLGQSLKIPASDLTLFKLNPQKKMTKLDTTLEAYGVQNKSDLLVVRKAEPPKPAAPKPLTPGEQINKVVSDVDNELGGRIKAFVQDPPTDPDEREKENRVLSEIILAKTISLDNVEVSTPEERQARRQAIATLQQYHRDIDKAMARKEEQAKNSTDKPEPSSPTSGGKKVRNESNKPPGGSTSSPQKVQSSGESEAAGSTKGQAKASSGKKKGKGKRKGKN